MKFVSIVTIAVIVAFLVNDSYQWIYENKASTQKYFHSLPIVVPAAESDFRRIWIPFDTITDKDGQRPFHALISLGLVEDRFLFGGHSEKHVSDPNGKCANLVVSKRISLCSQNFFYLSADTVSIDRAFVEKSIKRASQLYLMCNDVVKGTAIPAAESLVKFENSVLMAYKHGAREKCIGTYDMAEDSFSCELGAPKSDDLLVIPNFLFKNGEFRRVENSVEVFCRSPYDR